MSVFFPRRRSKLKRGAGAALVPPVRGVAQCGGACLHALLSLFASVGVKGRKVGVFGAKARKQGIPPVGSGCGRAAESARAGVSSRSLLYARFFHTLSRVRRPLSKSPSNKPNPPNPNGHLFLNPTPDFAPPTPARPPNPPNPAKKVHKGLDFGAESAIIRDC